MQCRAASLFDTALESKIRWCITVLHKLHFPRTSVVVPKEDRLGLLVLEIASGRMTKEQLSKAIDILTIDELERIETELAAYRSRSDGAEPKQRPEEAEHQLERPSNSN
jgi:hypothetical protein